MRFARFLGIAGCLFALVAVVGTGASSQPPSSALPPLAFRTSPEWLTVTTGTLKTTGLEPQVWAITARADLSALVPFDLSNGLRRLGKNAVLIQASNLGRGGPTSLFRGAAWPLQLRDFRLDRAWEGQPRANVQQRLRWASVAGWQLDVRVYFATQRPSKRLLGAAQAELDHLRLPGSS